LKDPPLAVLAATDRLAFRVAPLSPKGLLSQQVRDALKVLIRDHRSATIVKLRAFVAGTGDMRRVQAIVSEVFTDKHLPLPALTTVQAGALPMEGAQVAIESIAVEKKSVTPAGVAFLAAMAPAELQAALKAVGLSGKDVLRATCFMGALDTVGQLRSSVQTAFPAAAIDIVQMQRLPVRAHDTCEVAARLERAPVSKNANVAFATAPNIVLTSAQLAFHAQDADVKLAFERLQKTLESMNVGYKNVIAANLYPIADDIAAKIRAVQFEFFDRARKPAISIIPMEGLPSLDASFAVEVIAVP
jgi:enamine deaminase RidA (YjgF/YER057c/UK114 family)